MEKTSVLVQDASGNPFGKVSRLSLTAAVSGGKTIQQYCSFVEKMYYDGDEDVKNVVEVTILEQLSDEEEVWLRFGTYLSNEFIREINTVLIPRNTMLPNRPLPYHSRKKLKRLRRSDS